ncbi:MAG: hypothetical protein A2091_02415 [Desulfuromonadales bacterium GWD2_61_12]|nr:MAG: hypothetical protein A2005_04050 [Desulfuromonadales bacterium GWC2_61_20]OGR34157.1 MAG: hypothetical protein A2091_02415 [Desulfuromonadales bacterium GWD2_61_12]HAD03445.1 hypothetical protein [Desulfuromonas sp.]HBT83464.1 hypothetical protein [Desulfuromonas sp.]
MTRCLSLLALALLCLLLQTAVLPAFLPAALKPELLLLLTVYLMLIEDFVRGGMLAWSFGWLLDVTSGAFLGLHAVVYLTIFLLGRWAILSLNGESRFLLLVMVAAVSFVQPLLLLFFGFFADLGGMWLVVLQHLVFQAGTNVLCAALLLLLVTHLHRRYPGRLRLPGIIHLKSAHGS